MQNMTTLMTGLNLRQGFTQSIATATPARHSGSIDNTVSKIFNHFFEGLKVIFPASIAVLKTASDIAQFKSQWIAAFAENNINSDRMIKAGLRIARQQKSPFLPSVGQFIDWCQQGCAEDYGLPTPQQLCKKLQAYCRVRGHDDMQDFNYGSDANYWLVHDLYRAMIDRRLSAKELENEAKELIGRLSQKLRNGYVVQKPRVTIAPQQASKPTSREQSLENIRKIKERFKFSKVKPSGRKPSTQPSLDEKLHDDIQEITAPNVELMPETSSTHDDYLNENLCDMLEVNNIDSADVFEEKTKLNDNTSSLVDEPKHDNALSTIDNPSAWITEISDASDEMLLDIIGDGLEQIYDNFQSILIRQNTDISQVMPENLIATQSSLSHPTETHFNRPITLSRQFSTDEVGKRILVHPKVRRINLSSQFQNTVYQTQNSTDKRFKFTTQKLEEVQKVIPSYHCWRRTENRFGFDFQRLYCSRSDSDIRLIPLCGIRNHRHLLESSSIRSSIAHKEVPNDILTQKLVST